MNKRVNLKETLFQSIFLVFIVFLTIIFIFLKEQNHKMILGGAIFIFLSIKCFFFDSNLIRFSKKQSAVKVESLVIAFLLFILAIFIFSVSTLLPEDTNLFIIISLLLLIGFIFVLSLFWKLLPLGEKAVSFMSIVLPLNMAALISLGTVLAFISDSGINSFGMYFQVILLIIICLWYTTLTIRIFFEAIAYLFSPKNNLISNNAFHFNIAITLNILIGGYFYLVYISQNDLRDFLLLMGSLLTIWLAIYPNMIRNN